MPPQSKRGECPLQWWCDIRRNLGLSGSSFPLQLGVLHRILFPERLALSKKWHDPGVDVTMTMQIIKAYFDRTKMGAIPGKIDYYFSPQKNDVDEEDGDEDRMRIGMRMGMRMTTTILTIILTAILMRKMWSI